MIPVMMRFWMPHGAGLSPPEWPTYDYILYLVGDGDLVNYGNVGSQSWSSGGSYSFSTDQAIFTTESILLGSGCFDAITTSGTGDLQSAFNDDWTMAIWIYPLSRDNEAGSSQEQSVVSWMRRDNRSLFYNNSWRWYLDGSGYLKFAQFTESGGLVETLDIGTDPVPLNQWSYLELNFDYASGVTANQLLRGFINGELLLETKPYHTGFGSAGEGLWVGSGWRTPASPCDSFNGHVSQFIVWKGLWNTSDYAVPIEMFPVS